jgi:hypothetical protein
VGLSFCGLALAHDALRGHCRFDCRVTGHDSDSHALVVRLQGPKTKGRQRKSLCNTPKPTSVPRLEWTDRRTAYGCFSSKTQKETFTYGAKKSSKRRPTPRPLTLSTLVYRSTSTRDRNHENQAIEPFRLTLMDCEILLVCDDISPTRFH